jgi:acyl-CoA dehydrogenase
VACGSQAPDSGNAEILWRFGTDEQKARWLTPLVNGDIRSCFSMTEPEVAGSDPRLLRTTAKRDGDDYVINGHKWWISGAADERCKIFIVMGKTDLEAPRHRQQSMVLVPRDTPGLVIDRHLPTFGYQDQHGHSELTLTDVRVPVTNLLGDEGGGFRIAQARLGPGRIHHCMRLIGMAERSIDLMVRRAQSRVAFGRPLAEQGVVREQIALSRIEVEQARLLVLKTAWLIDSQGAKGAATEIAAIKVTVPRMACGVIDRAIQIHGGGGITDITPLPAFYAWARALRLADGPDEVHLRTVARQELGRHA